MTLPPGTPTRVSWVRQGAAVYPHAERWTGSVWVSVEAHVPRGKLHWFAFSRGFFDMSDDDRQEMEQAVRDAAQARGIELPEDAPVFHMSTWDSYWREQAEIELLVNKAEIEARTVIGRETEDKEEPALFRRSRLGS